jgi:hypothetical protein
VFYLQQKFDDAINYSRRALKEKPGLPIATFYLMASPETRQNLDEAEQLLSQPGSSSTGDRALQQVREVIRRRGQGRLGPSAGVSGTKSVERAKVERLSSRTVLKNQEETEMSS